VRLLKKNIAGLRSELESFVEISDHVQQKNQPASTIVQ